MIERDEIETQLPPHKNLEYSVHGSILSCCCSVFFVQLLLVQIGPTLLHHAIPFQILPNLGQQMQGWTNLHL